jgi:hypothetical protein
MGGHTLTLEVPLLSKLSKTYLQLDFLPNRTWIDATIASMKLGICFLLYALEYLLNLERSL